MSKDTLPDEFPVNAAKISSKNNPSLLLRTDDCLHKLPSNVLESYQTFNRNLDRIRKIKNIKSLRDFVESLKENNKKIDDLSIIYFDDGETSELNTKALRILRYES